LYVRAPGNPVDDVKFFDLGEISIFTQGMQTAGSNIGELWISYDIEFYKPKINAAGNNDPASDVYYPNQFTPLGLDNLVGPNGNIIKPRVSVLGSHIESFGPNNGFGVYFPETMVEGVYELQVLIQTNTAAEPYSAEINFYDAVTPYAHLVSGGGMDTATMILLDDTHVMITALAYFDGKSAGSMELDVESDLTPTITSLFVSLSAFTTYNPTFVPPSERKPVLKHSSQVQRRREMPPGLGKAVSGMTRQEKVLR
jgi:hypothetical protein